MNFFGGIALTFVTVFGGYTLAGGKIGVILHSLPFEMMQILGAAIGATLLSNSMSTVKGILGDIKLAMGGPRWKRDDYRDLLCMLYELTKLMKGKGAVAVEAHIEKPDESPIFQKYPKITHDHFILPFVCDTIRMMTMDLESSHQLEDVMNRQIEKHHHEASAPAGALQSMADALPALGIVAAVLGVIKTMASINEPPEVLGHMIGGALVGTFLGVFLAYGFIGPIATRMKQSVDEDGQFVHIIRDILVAYLHGNAVQVAVEIGRGNVPSLIQPTFAEMESAMDNLPALAAA